MLLSSKSRTPTPHSGPDLPKIKKKTLKLDEIVMDMGYDDSNIVFRKILGF